MAFSTLAVERYSLRKFSDRPVEPEKLTAILEAGRSAPTAHNNQPQRILVFQSTQALARAEACTSCLFHPPVMLAVCCDPAAAWVRDGDGKNYGEIDAAIVTTQMMLQAADLGLGTTCVGMFDPEKLRAAFPEALAGLEIVALLPLGYPAENARPSRLHGDRKPLAELVQYL
ncbi:MAG: nitroreductase family protein [Oscillospiraceae bacterium]|nr:nitroreductase family protein [Oscillospiraceae bacterium]